MGIKHFGMCFCGKRTSPAFAYNFIPCHGFFLFSVLCIILNSHHPHHLFFFFWRDKDMTEWLRGIDGWMLSEWNAETTGFRHFKEDQKEIGSYKMMQEWMMG